MSETLETYICNIGEGKAEPVDSGRQGQSRQHAAACEHHHHRTALVGALGLAEEDLMCHGTCAPAAMAGQRRTRRRWETNERTAREQAAQAMGCGAVGHGVAGDEHSVWKGARTNEGPRYVRTGVTHGRPWLIITAFRFVTWEADTALKIILPLLKKIEVSLSNYSKFN